MFALRESTKENLTYPFLNEQGKVDPVRAKELVSAHPIFKENVNQFIRLHDKVKNGEDLSAQEALFYNEATQLPIKHYIAPPLQKIAMLYEDYKKGKKFEKPYEYPDGSIRLSSKLFPPGFSIPQDIRTYFPILRQKEN